MKSSENEYKKLISRNNVAINGQIITLYNEIFKRNQNVSNLKKFFEDELSRELFLLYI